MNKLQVNTALDSNLDIYQIISLLPLTPYHKVVHMFPSTGALSVQLGKIVYRGRVISLDTFKNNLASIRKELKKIRLTNVKTSHIQDESNLNLKDASFDGAIISFALTNSRNLAAIFNESNRFIVTGGWLSLIDEHPKNDNVMPLNEYKDIVEKSGFRFHTKYNLSDSIYMMIFRK